MIVLEYSSFFTGVDSVVEDSSKIKEREVVGRSSAANDLLIRQFLRQSQRLLM